MNSFLYGLVGAIGLFQVKNSSVFGDISSFGKKSGLYFRNNFYFQFGTQRNKRVTICIS
jgi:hypothetical protein